MPRLFECRVQGEDGSEFKLSHVRAYPISAVLAELDPLQQAYVCSYQIEKDGGVIVATEHIEMNGNVQLVGLFLQAYHYDVECEAALVA